jgi:hypothetical protein
MMEAFDSEEKRRELHEKLQTIQTAVERILGAEAGVLDIYPSSLIDSFFGTNEPEEVADDKG